MNQTSIDQEEFLDALKKTAMFYKDKHKTFAQANFNEFLQKKYPELLDSICYQSFERFAYDERKKEFWKEKDSEKQLIMIIEYSKDNHKFKNFLELANIQIFNKNN